MKLTKFGNAVGNVVGALLVGMFLILVFELFIKLIILLWRI